jgi:hypothetical protein
VTSLSPTSVGGAIATALAGDAKGFLLKRFGVDPGVGMSGLVASLEGSGVGGATKSHVSGMTMGIVAAESSRRSKARYRNQEAAEGRARRGQANE